MLNNLGSNPNRCLNRCPCSKQLPKISPNEQRSEFWLRFFILVMPMVPYVYIYVSLLICFCLHMYICSCNHLHSLGDRDLIPCEDQTHFLINGLSYNLANQYFISRKPKRNMIWPRVSIMRHLVRIEPQKLESVNKFSLLTIAL